MPTTASVQAKIEIEDIKDGVVLLKNNSLRAVLMTTSINFALKSTEEQEAITYRYQEVLNSLDFPVQIVIVSRKFNVTEYLNFLEQKQKEQGNELLRIQITEYIDFIRGLTELANIMTQSFYVVVPFALIEKKETGLLEKVSAVFTSSSSSVKTEDFEQLKTQLWQRVSYLSAGLEGLGIKTAPLNNEELIELYYGLYNPEAKEKPRTDEVNKP